MDMDQTLPTPRVENSPLLSPHTFISSSITPAVVPEFLLSASAKQEGNFERLKEMGKTTFRAPLDCFCFYTLNIPTNCNYTLSKSLVINFFV